MKFKEGDKVEAQYKGKSRFYPGVISRCRLNGTYDIDYDDGEKETSVVAELIQPRSHIVGYSSDYEANVEKTSSSRLGIEARSESKSSNSVSSHVAYRVGTRIEARYMQKDLYYKGTISRVNDNGTYVIEYDDGDKESSVAKSLIRPLISLSSFRGDDFAMGKPIRSSMDRSLTRRSGNLSD
ncbi:putative Tudor domain, Agenet domain, plant type, histone methyltransferase, Tudor domain 1 [Plasmopara halstedii]